MEYVSYKHREYERLSNFFELYSMWDSGRYQLLLEYGRFCGCWGVL